jgi:hypothetical protein
MSSRYSRSPSSCSVGAFGFIWAIDSTSPWTVDRMRDQYRTDHMPNVGEELGTDCHLHFVWLRETNVPLSTTRNASRHLVNQRSL